MDSTEPDHFHPIPEDFDTPTYLGSFRKVRNAYPLMSVGGVYDHQRAVTSDKRVFILTRSAFCRPATLWCQYMDRRYHSIMGSFGEANTCGIKLLTMRHSPLEQRYRRILPMAISLDAG